MPTKYVSREEDIKALKRLEAESCCVTIAWGKPALSRAIPQLEALANLQTQAGELLHYVKDEVRSCQDAGSPTAAGVWSELLPILELLAKEPT